MKHDSINYVSAGISWILTAIQFDEVLRYVNLGLSIFLTCLSIGVSLYNIIKSARKTGEIKKEDIQGIVDDVHDLQDQLNGRKDKEEDGNQGKA